MQQDCLFGIDVLLAPAPRLVPTAMYGLFLPAVDKLSWQLIQIVGVGRVSYWFVGASTSELLHLTHLPQAIFHNEV